MKSYTKMIRKNCIILLLDFYTLYKAQTTNLKVIERSAIFQKEN